MRFYLLRRPLLFFLPVLFLPGLLWAEENVPPVISGALVRNSPLMPVMAKLSVSSDSEDRKIRFVASLRNGTSETIRFDRIDKSCSCTQVSPTRAVVEPGEKVEFTIEQELSNEPQTKHPGGSFNILSGDILEGVISYDIELQDYLGFGTRFIDLVKEVGSNSVSFVVPIVLGAKQASATVESLSDPYVELEGFPSGFVLKSRMDWKASSLHCQLGWPESATDFPYIGNLSIVTEYRSGFLTVPISLSRKDAFQVHPISLRFLRSSDDGTWVAKGFLRCADSSENPIVVVVDGPASLVLATEPLGAGIKKLNFVLHDREAIADADSDGQRKPISVRVRGSQVAQTFELRYSTPLDARSR
ncbi:hypothetical protein Pla22_07840 [Rubripirellula amarantea]|uniref:DUF1573 domain-containing protein n=1 Tax=Rubripirellula amarantea TaxID=2527999 RepID=A0A5C5WQS8_9BACT|nr:DUF1573 domain-containing protein [Rubripirellula amarantea]TWT53156.1 hypothetical protein Pla22_07840 [Rubripirellula amarantea]